MKENTNNVITIHQTENDPDSKVALISNISALKEDQKTRFLVEGFFVLIVSSGSVSFTINSQVYELTAGDIFCCLPRNVLEQSVMSEDFAARAIYMSPKFAENIAQRVRVNWTFSMVMSKYEKLHAEPEILDSLLQYFDLVKAKSELPESRFTEQIIVTLFVAMCYEICDLRSRSCNTPPPVQSSAAENLMRRFMKLLYESDHRMRSVQEYADSLCVSSKYFSSICRQVTGKNARDLINEDLVRSIKLLLADNTLYIKQIADACGFKNQSHFGTFFRRHMGISPQQYRDSLRHKK